MNPTEKHRRSRSQSERAVSPDEDKRGRASYFVEKKSLFEERGGEKKPPDGPVKESMCGRPTSLITKMALIERDRGGKESLPLCFREKDDCGERKKGGQGHVYTGGRGRRHREQTVRL